MAKFFAILMWPSRVDAQTKIVILTALAYARKVGEETDCLGSTLH